MIEKGSQKLEAAELLLAVAIEERDEAQGRINWLTALVARYKATPPAQGGNDVTIGLFPPTESDGGGAAGEDDDEEGGDSGRLYGKVRAGVLKVLHEALPRKLTMSEAAVRFEKLGIQTNAKSSLSSVRHAMKGLLKTGKVKKIGQMHYRAVTES
jgi:hypothetical protein